MNETQYIKCPKCRKWTESRGGICEGCVARENRKKKRLTFYHLLEPDESWEPIAMRWLEEGMER